MSLNDNINWQEQLKVYFSNIQHTGAARECDFSCSTGTSYWSKSEGRIRTLSEIK